MISLADLIGTKVVSRETAEDVGAVHGALVDVAASRVVAWQVGKGRKARLVDQAHVTGIDDAMVIDGEESLREPADHREEQLLKGHGALLGSLVLGDDGTERGEVSDVEVDPETGALGVLSAGDGRFEPDTLLGLGAYALVVAA